jgi:hypothetical protein
MFAGRTIVTARRTFAIVALCVLGACGDSQKPAGPTAPKSDLGPISPTLVECPTKDTKTSSVTILDPSIQNVVSLDGSKVVIPPGAVPLGSTVYLTIPASRYMEIGVRVDDQEHFPIALPIFITIDYSRCQRSDVLTKPVTAWNIDPDTKQLLENMGGADDKLTESITFQTGHLSGYAIAF